MTISADDPVYLALKAILEEFGIDIDDDSMDWSDPRLVETSRGKRVVMDSAPSEDFWNVWRERKDEVKATGLAVNKRDENWQVTFWGDPEKIGLSDSDLSRYKR